MRVVAFDNPADFAARVTPLLVRREAENNFLLGKISEFLSGQAAPPGTLLLSVEDGAADGPPVAAALMTPPHPLVITRAAGEAEVLDALVRHLASANIRPRAVSGPDPAPRAFASEWCAATSAALDSEFALGLYELTQLVSPRTPPPGSFRPAAEADVETLVPWADEFFREIHHFTPPDARTVVTRRIGLGQLFLWCDPEGRPVSMAGWAGPTPRGVRINFVYTPPTNRGRGYATGCVAALTQHLLESGKAFCFLFTDLANPTSNGIYRRLGYRHVCDFRDVRFEPAGD